MEVYKGFSYVYDLLMQEVPYEKWLIYIQALFDFYKQRPGLILDLGCGTGTFTKMLSEAGYDMIGLDISQDMLSVAKEKDDVSLYIHQDMQSFELFGTVDCIISLCDSMNYIIEEDGLLSVFKLANNYLNPGGLLIFDLNTEYVFAHKYGDNVFADVYEGLYYIWENSYDWQKKINEYALTFFMEQKNGLYTKYEELHYERAYTEKEIIRLLEKSGLILLHIFDAYTFDAPKKTSERIFVIARENGK